MGCKSCREKREAMLKRIAEEKNKKKEPEKPEKPEKNAFLVLAFESSGCRFLTHQLIRMGCKGSAEHHQYYDDHDPTEPLIVLRRSIPHGNNYCVNAAIIRLKKLGYKVTVLLLVRDWWPMLRSSIKNNHIKNKKQKQEQLHHGFLALSRIEQDTPIYPICYQTLYNGKLYDWLISEFNYLKKPRRIARNFKNGDQKHWELL